jgi:hypothetical protein
MSTCTPNLKHSFLTIWEIVTFKVEEKVSFHVPKQDCSILEAKKTTFSNRFRMSLFRALFLSDLGTCSQNFMPTKDVVPWEKHQFTRWNSHTKAGFDNNKCLDEKLLYWKSKWPAHALVPLLHMELFFFWETLRSQFLVAF